MKAIDASKYLLHLADSKGNYDITNLKLQKLLYYAQGAFLAIHNERFFDESIKKWQYGPVVPEVYHYYRAHGNQLLPVPMDVNWSELDDSRTDILNEVYGFFGQFSGIKLMDMTHNESPWFKTKLNKEMTDEVLKEYFKTIIK